MAAFPPARSSPCAERRATEQVRELSSQHVTTVEMNRLFAALTAFMIMAVLAAAPQSASAADGKTVYAEICVVCLGEQWYVRICAVSHGDKGFGAMRTQSCLNPSPRDFTAAAARDELSRERMILSVTYGRPGTAMMSFRKRLSADEIETVVDYIRASFFMKGPAPAAPHPQFVQADMSLPFPDQLKGDATKGREFYEHNCFTCHGLEGNGEGPRAKFITPRPRNFLAMESRLRLNRPALFTAVHDGLRGTVMPAWGKVLNDQQIADVAEYVFTTFVHPPRGGAAEQQAGAKKKLNAP